MAVEEAAIRHGEAVPDDPPLLAGLCEGRAGKVQAARFAQPTLLRAHQSALKLLHSPAALAP